jgi:hypothetical protein
VKKASVSFHKEVVALIVDKLKNCEVARRIDKIVNGVCDKLCGVKFFEIFIKTIRMKKL